MTLGTAGPATLLGPATILSADAMPPPPQDSIQESIPQDWTLTESEEPPADLKPWMNVLTRRTFILTHPGDPAQTLYWYAEERPAPEGEEGKAGEEWFSRFGHSQQAFTALCRAWRRQDGYADEGEETINALATLARIFREATRSRQT